MDGLPSLDDSLFFEEKKKQNEDLSMPYNAKRCENEWFLEPDFVPDDGESVVNFHKFRADSLYLKADYDRALVEYKILADLDLSPLVRRDAMDGLVRCLLKLNKLCEANEIAGKMVSMSTNEDHVLHALLTLATVQRAQDRCEDLVETYQKCVHISPSAGSLWLKLARSYELLASHGRNGNYKTRNTIHRLICLLNARHLLKTPHLAASFLDEKNSMTLKTINDDIKAYALNPEMEEKLSKLSFQTTFSSTNADVDEVRSCGDVGALFARRWYSEHIKLLDAG